MAFQKQIENRPVCCGREMGLGRGKAESGRARFTCSQCGRSTTGSGDAELGYDAAEAKAYAKTFRKQKRQRVIVTSAVNNCAPNWPAWRSLLALAEDVGAQVMVIPIHYKNISLYTAGQQYKKWWHEAFKPHLMGSDVALGANVRVRGDWKVQATALDPLRGKHSVTGTTWSIFGHPQIGMEPVATPATKRPGRMYSTGAMTVKSYSDTDKGKKAAHHHSTGALLIEIDGDRAFAWNLNADSVGRIYWLSNCYYEDQILRDRRILSLTMGDEHVKWMKPGVKRATFTAEDSIVNTLQPEYLVRHDVLDWFAGSHHHDKKWATEYAKHVRGHNDGRKELNQAVDHINATTPDNCCSLIVSSNHHDHLSKWLDRVDSKRDHVNGALADELRMMCRQWVDENPSGTPDMFRVYCEQKLTCKFDFLDPSVPFILAGVSMENHGHVGVSGARGSAKSFAKSAYKANLGHAHSARICRGVYQSGKSTGILEYEQGLSESSNTHIIQYENGKRTLVDIHGQQWRGRDA
ncbi:MAG: hypothetical protein AAF358_13605 [Pseudomonadota bacterium]